MTILSFHSKLIKNWYFLEACDHLRYKINSFDFLLPDYLELLLDTGYLEEAVREYKLKMVDSSFDDNDQQKTPFYFLNSLIKHKKDFNYYNLLHNLFLNDCDGVVDYISRVYSNNRKFDFEKQDKYILSYAVNFLISKNRLSEDLAENIFWNCINEKASGVAALSVVKKIIIHLSLNCRRFFSYSGERRNLLSSLYRYIDHHNNSGDFFRFYDSLLKGETNFAFNKQASEPKVAICVSGMFKISTEQLKTIRDNLARPLNADIFLHAWDDFQVWAGSARLGENFWDRNFQGINFTIPKYAKDLDLFKKYFSRSSNLLLSDFYKKISLDEIYSVITPKKIIIESSKDFRVNVASSDDYLCNEKMNQSNMVYGIWRSFQMMRCYELENNFRYDYVIRVRPDNIIEKEFDKKNLFDLKSNSIAVPLYFHGIADDMFYARREAYEKMASLWGAMYELKGFHIFKNLPKYDSHNLFFAWMHYSGLVAKKFNISRSYKKSYLFAKIPGLRDALNEDLYEFKKIEKIKEEDQIFFDFLFSLAN